MPTILLIEDNALTRKLVRVTLAPEGFDVLEVNSGARAIEELQQRIPDLVLLDLGLCDVDGFDLFDQLRRIAPRTPFVAFTGLNDEGRLRKAGFCEVLVKPVEPLRLVQMVTALTQASPGSGLALPRATTRDRAWHAVTSMLARLTELITDAYSVREAVGLLLESLLDAAGFPFGIAWSAGSDGTLRRCAQIGWTEERATWLAALWEGESALARALDTGLPVGVSRSAGNELFDSHLGSVILVPLQRGDRPIGVLLLGSPNELTNEWLQLAAVLGGPITQAITLASTAARLSASEHKFRGIADSTGDGIVLTDARGRINFVNDAAERLLGRHASSTLGLEIAAVIPFLATGSSTGNINHDGHSVPIDVTTRMFDDPPGVPNHVYLLRDLSDRAQLEHLATLANQDALTGIANRRRFDEFLAGRLANARRHDLKCSLLLVDLDHFKAINDTYGHQAGDLVLRAVANVIASHTRSSDLGARFGGDELAMVLDHTGVDGARTCAAKVRAQISELEIPFAGTTIRIAASVGIATFPSDAVTPEELLGAADRALYQVKQRRSTTPTLHAVAGDPS
jgi:diguanylate cyclase (GGDEF)-like protein